MRPVLCGLAAGAFVCSALTASAQQGSVRISAAAQGVTGSPQRLAGENQIEPDFGVAWLQPGARFGTFQIELRGARRADRLHLGRNYVALRDLPYAGLTWTFEAGDTYFTRGIGEYGFTNLTTPAVTFSGGTVSGRSRRGHIQVVGGRTTAWRNIFGTDPDTLGQTLALVRGGYRFSDRLETLGSVSRIQTSGLREFTFSIADSRQSSGGIRFTPLPAVQIVADGSLVHYRRLDSDRHKRDGSFLVGSTFHLSRGWMQVNRSRFSPGEFPAMNDPLHDRESTFAAGEYDLWSRLRIFAGWETLRTNIDPDPLLASSRDAPHNVASRGFGGVRVQLGSRATVTFRAEEGDRQARPVFSGLDRESDTGLRSAEWQSAFGSVTTYMRISRRDNVDHENVDATYTQDDVSGQVFLRLSRSTQMFGLGTFSRHQTASETGSSYWQIGGGAQVQVLQQNLWLRGEGAASRNVDLQTRDFVPRESFNIGLNGELARGTSFAFNISADRTPLLFGTGTPWTTRSTLRIVQTFSTGATRIAARGTGLASEAGRRRGTGTILGIVYRDWNGNGRQDPDDDPLENIPVRIAAIGSAATRRDGEFSFLNVPAGVQDIDLDRTAIPVDFDPPAESSVTLELDRGTTRRVTFGLIPLGSVRGRVVRDANANGRADPDEEPLDGAVLMLDRGARSEQVRKGVFLFDSIRSGEHVIALLRESLPEGAVVTGVTEHPLALTRNQMSVHIDFAIAVEKRPETRRVFPARGGASLSPQPKPTATASRTASGADATSPAPRGSRPSAPAASAVGRDASRLANAPSAGNSPSFFTVQIAAFLDPLRARTLVRDLTAKGYAAYLLEPATEDPDGPYRVRIGHYPTRAAATAAIASLQRSRGEKLWVIRGFASDQSEVEKPKRD